MRRTVWIVVLLLLMLMTICQSEYFTAISDVVRVTQQEEKIISELSSYLSEEIDKMTRIKGFLNELRQDLDYTKDESYFGNPINVYRELNEIVLDRKLKLESLFERPGIDNDHNESVNKTDSGLALISRTLMNSDDDRLTKVREMIDNLPGYDDLRGSMDGLFRLQDVYKLDVSLLARGQGLGEKGNSGLDAYQCFGLGYYAHLNQDFFHASQWLNEAYELQRNDNSPSKDHKVSTITMLEYLSHSLYKLGKIQSAQAMNNAIIALGKSSFPSTNNSNEATTINHYLKDTTNEQALTNKDHFQDLLDRERMAGSRRDGERMESSTDYLINNEMTSEIDNLHYEGLCRGEKLQSTANKVNLKCDLLLRQKDYPYVPFKREIIWDEPLIMIFHDVISDDEIEHIKRLVGPKLKRATVQNAKTGDMEPADYRISKSTWLQDDEDETTKELQARIKGMTGLNMETAEHFQIANYGIGGQYEPHYDHALDDENNFFEDNIGNRVATLMFYMSDVEAGGDTVFTEVNIRVRPIKNAAIFWWNLHSSGRSDDRTRHAACPVLLGSKWVMNKWLHLRGQEFIRPCLPNQK